MDIDLSKCSSDGKIAYLIKPILSVLKEAGGKLERREIKNKICELDEQIAVFSEVTKTSKTTGNTYKEFTFKFNFAIQALSFVKYLTYSKGSTSITLTERGLNVDLEEIDIDNDIINPCKKIWNRPFIKKTESKCEESTVEYGDEASSADQILSDFKETLLQAIAVMSPKKFEDFSRALLTKMGVSFTDRGLQISKDGGIDGYGYHKDNDDFRTTRVVIQCKRYNAIPVSAPEINQFLGAMDKFKADYGVFITNGRFTKDAREASRAGSPITLIDGNDLVDLVIRYQLFITPVTTYVLNDFYLN